MFYTKIMAVVHRYRMESDIKCFGLVGVLEAAKVDLLEFFKLPKDDE